VLIEREVFQLAIREAKLKQGVMIQRLRVASGRLPAAIAK
jgi:hypothetical protein